MRRAGGSLAHLGPRVPCRWLAFTGEGWSVQQRRDLGEKARARTLPPPSPPVHASICFLPASSHASLLLRQAGILRMTDASAARPTTRSLWETSDGHGGWEAWPSLRCRIVSTDEADKILADAVTSTEYEAAVIADTATTGNRPPRRDRRAEEKRARRREAP